MRTHRSWAWPLMGVLVLWGCGKKAPEAPKREPAGRDSIQAQLKTKADRKTAELLVRQTVMAVKLYHAAMNRYPETDPGLRALIDQPEDEKDAENWISGGGPFLVVDRIPVDPWGHELKYEHVVDNDTGTFHVWSAGADGQDGTEDDIRSWTE